MTDPELRDRLAALRPPGSSDAVRSRALFRAHLALDAAAHSSLLPRARFPLLRFASGTLLGAVAALALGF